MFFYDIQDFQKHVPVNAGFDFDVMSVYLRDVDKSIFKKYLGSDLLQALQVAFDAKQTFDEIDSPEKELIGYLRDASANIALVKWLPIGQVSIGQGGVQINSSAEMKTAFQWQIKDIEARCNEVGFNALEAALEYLEKNIDEAEFADYKASDEFKQNNYLFVPSSQEFCKYYSAFENSRINFYKLRSVIKKVEDFEIKAVILPDYFNDLKTKLQAGETLGGNAQIIVDMIKPALVHLAVAKAIADLSVMLSPEGIVLFDNTGGRETSVNTKHADNQSLYRIAVAAEKDGRAYLKILADYIEANKGNYPLFTADSLYVEPEDVPDLNADTDNKMFFGL